MTKEEIIKMYLNDLKNLIKDTPARQNRIEFLENELKLENNSVLVDVNNNEVALLPCKETGCRNPNEKIYRGCDLCEFNKQ